MGGLSATIVAWKFTTTPSELVAMTVISPGQVMSTWAWSEPAVKRLNAAKAVAARDLANRNAVRVCALISSALNRSVSTEFLYFIDYPFCCFGFRSVMPALEPPESANGVAVAKGVEQ